MDFSGFQELTRNRRAVRHFKSDPVPADILEALLETAHWAPSGYNLQPLHLVVVTDPKKKEALLAPCMNQKQIVEAPVVVVFCGDLRTYENHFEETLRRDREAGAINGDYEKLLRHFVPLAFERGPLDSVRAGKAVVGPLLRLFAPIPQIPAVDPRYWATKQVMLATMVFMLGAAAAGLATVPMEGFDEGRVRQVLGIPSSICVPLIVPLGYAATPPGLKTRLPVERIIHRNGW